MAKKKPSKRVEDTHPPVKPLRVDTPAFPHCITKGDPCGQRGMDLRDYLAAHAMQGLIASNDEGAGDRLEELPEYAYAIADAMLRARKH